MIKTISVKKECRVTIVGGGSGISVILRGLKKITTNIKAIVTMADDGGSSGKIREDLGQLPPGDIRNCILALANVEGDMQKLFNYRFEAGALEDQNVGNIIIAALVELHGGYDEAMVHAHEIFAVTGKVLPVTFDDVKLIAELENGKFVYGESKIPKQVLETESQIERVYLEPSIAKPANGVIEAILDTDFLILGPGSLYTSIIPNLLVEGIADAIKESKAKKIFIPNIMTQPGETDLYSVFDHVESIGEYVGMDTLDYLFVNQQILTKSELEKYAQEGATPIRLTDEERAYLINKKIDIIEKDFLDIKKGYIRHDADKVAAIIQAMYEAGTE